MASRGREFWRRIERTLAQRHLQRRSRRTGATGGRRSMRYRRAEPAAGPRTSSGKQQSLNNLSVVTGRSPVVVGECCLQGTWNGGLRNRLVQSDIFTIDLLKVPHHGALGSLDRGWLLEQRSAGYHQWYLPGAAAPMVIPRMKSSQPTESLGDAAVVNGSGRRRVG